MTFDVTSLLGTLPVTAREITRDETSISWRKVKLRLSVSRSNAPSPESVHEDLPDYEDTPEGGSHTENRGGAENDDEESEEEDELEDDQVASDTDYSNPLPTSPPHLPSALGLDFSSPIDLTQDDQADQVLSQLAGIDLRGDSADDDSSSETRLAEAEAFIASAVLQSQTLVPSPPSPPSPPNELLHEHYEIQSTTMTVRRRGRYETIYSLSDPDDDEGYFEISRPSVARWSSTPSLTPTHTTTIPTKSPRKTPAHRELSLHPRLPSFLSIIPRYHRTYSSTWFKQNTRVKRVLEARERRQASNPAVGGGGGEFVKKAVERFGPSWRVKVPSVFRHGLRKKEKAEESIVDVASNNERMRAGYDINRPVNVPRVVNPARLTGLSAMDRGKPEQTSLSIHPDTTMVVQNEEVPECIVVPSTPPPSLPFPRPTPPQPPLPYLTSHSSTNQTTQLDHPYPYIPTPLLDPVSLPTPRLTREASFASENSSFVPTPESGRLALPTLGVPTVPEYVDGKSVKYGSPSADDGVAYPYEYIATPPLPSLSLTPTPAPIVPPSLPHSFLPFPFTLAPSATVPSIPPHPQPIIPPPPLTLPTLLTTVQPPPPPLTTVLPSFPVGQPPPPLQPLHPPAPIIPPTLPLTLPTRPTAVPVPAPPLTTVLPSFPVGQPPPPLPPLVPPLVPRPSLSVVPLATLGTGYMRSSQPPPPPASSSFFHGLESQVITQPPSLSSVGSGSGLTSHPGSASGSVPQSFMPPGGPTLSSTATAPALQLQTQLPSSDRITVPEPESMDCREDAYAPLIVMTSPTEAQPRRPDFVMGEEGGSYTVLRPDPGQINTELLGAKSGEVTTHAFADGPSYQRALDSGYASAKEGKGKRRATDDGDGLDGDPPPFDESDPLWEELLAYKADPNGDRSDSACVDPAGLGQEVAEILGGDPTGAFDLSSSSTSWDFSAVLDPADSNPPEQPKSEDTVWKELCAWADEQPPEMLESVFGMLDTSESFVAEGPSVELVGFGDFPPLEESQPLELLVPTIVVEAADSSPTPEGPSHPQFAQDAIYSDGTERICKHSSRLEAPTSFTLDQLDWAVMEEYAQLEDLECPSSSVDAARVMVVAIRAVAAKAKSDGQAFLPVVDLPASYYSIAGGQSVSPSYEYVSLLDEDAQVPPVNSHYHQAYLPSTSLAHVLAAS